MSGNPYKDKKGHYTTKENDGGECKHDLGTLFDEKGYVKKGTNFTKYFDSKEKDYNITDDDWKEKQESYSEEFKQFNEKNEAEIIDEVAKRFTGNSNIWNMPPEAIERAKKILGGEITNDSIKKWFTERLHAQEINEETQLPTFKINTPERQQAREKWVKDEFDKQKQAREIKHDKVALITLGNAGSGKSSAGGKAFLNQYGAYEVDPDIFKGYIPEYQQNPDMIGVAHKESSNLAKDFMDQAISEGANIFYPTTGSNLEKLLKNIQKLKDAGYDVVVDYIELDPKENITRTMTRALETGRYTNANVIGGSYKGVEDFYKNKLIKSDLIDGWRLWDNNKKATIVNKGGLDL